jgi:hypothetical protein
MIIETKAELLMNVHLMKGTGIEANTPLKICGWICGGVAA